MKKVLALAFLLLSPSVFAQTPSSKELLQKTNAIYHEKGIGADLSDEESRDFSTLRELLSQERLAEIELDADQNCMTGEEYMKSAEFSDSFVSEMEKSAKKLDQMKDEELLWYYLRESYAYLILYARTNELGGKFQKNLDQSSELLTKIVLVYDARNKVHANFLDQNK